VDETQLISGGIEGVYLIKECWAVSLPVGRRIAPVDGVYAGAGVLRRCREKPFVEFGAGLAESHPHDVMVTKEARITARESLSESKLLRKIDRGISFLLYLSRGNEMLFF